MRKLPVLILSTAFAMGLIGCSAEKTTESKPKVEESKKEPTENEKKHEALVKRLNEANAKKDEEQANIAEEKRQKELAYDYVSYHETAMEKFRDDTDNLVSHLSTLEVEVLKTEDTRWIEKLGKNLVLVITDINSIRAYDKEIPQNLRESHDYLKQSMDEYEFVNDNIVDALDGIVSGTDDTLMNECLQKLLEGRKLLNLSSDSLHKQ